VKKRPEHSVMELGKDKPKWLARIDIIYKRAKGSTVKHIHGNMEEQP
jgi:hypothetical protein